MKQNETNEKFKTMIGGQALIEGIMMRGPEKDAIVCRTKDGLKTELMERKVPKPGSFATWPMIRGIVNFFSAQYVGVTALMKSADLAPEEFQEEEPSKFDRWLEKKLGSEKFQQALITFAVIFGIGFSVALFFLLPDVISGFFDRWIPGTFALCLFQGALRMMIFMTYMILVSRMQEMKRVFSYHGAEHKTIRCYEAQLPLTVENVRMQTRLHPRCGTSFLLIVMLLSILVHSVATSGLLAVAPGLKAMQGTMGYRLILITYKLLLLPLVVSIAYEFNRFAGRHDNAVTRILTAPGMWLQNWTTNEPDDGMIECAIEALKAVLPEQEGADAW